MSTFLRQFHIISSLKSNYDRDIIPFYKVIAPVLSRHPAVRKMHTQSINRNLQLKSVDEIENVSGKKKPLAVILAWMLAKESHIEKFRQLYISRGFDVLTVNMAPKDLLFPVSGSQVIAKNVLDYFTLHKNYKDIVVHAFSVGGYLMGEMFEKCKKDGKKVKESPSYPGFLYLIVLLILRAYQLVFLVLLPKIPLPLKSLNGPSQPI
ncbi:hypothetical protein HNY73_008725 [Argiope bruennichi]|uniref:Transmembrane protein 53 n=1 Tax=Argiope bruennichi TaxID=94029 RepID=A0A8T0FA52_ARGBR|nr:hypothetical protein HNY73_008725 [Argiope bruennichi]